MERSEHNELQEIVLTLVEGPTDFERHGAQARAQAVARDSERDHALLRDLLVEEIGKADTPDMALARSWLLDTLAQVAPDDDRARQVLRHHMDPEKEADPWVRYWALAGLWSELRRQGREEALEPLLDDEMVRDPDPLVRLLARALQAWRSDGAGPADDARSELKRALRDPELQFPALRALRIEPLPALREDVESLRGQAVDDTAEWNVDRVLASFDRIQEEEESVRQAGTRSSGGTRSAPEPRLRFAGRVLEILPDPSSVAAGAPFDVKIRIGNTGQAKWERLDRFRIGISLWEWNADDPLDDDQHVHTLERAVQPLQDVQISIRLAAPESPGRFVLRAHVYGDERWGTDSFVGEERTELEVIGDKTQAVEEAVEVKEGAEAQAGSIETVIPTLDPVEPVLVQPPDASPAHHQPQDGTVGVPEVKQSSAPPVVPPPTPSTPPPAVVHHLHHVDLKRYEPPPREKRLLLTLTEKSVSMEYGDRKYVSPLVLDPARLLSLEAQPLEYGNVLFEAVFNDETLGQQRLSTAHGYREAKQDSGAELRFEIEVQDPALRGVPWELLHEGGARPPIATRERTPMYRRVASREPEMVEPPLRVLVAISSPGALGKPGNRFLQALPPLEVEREAEAFEGDLERLREGGLVDYEVLGSDPAAPLTLEALTGKLQEGFHVLHFLGHGLYDGGGTFCLALQREDDDAQPMVRGEELAQAILSVAEQPRLVVLASCQSGRIAPDGEAGPALGTILVEQGLPAVVSMRRELGVETARYLNRRFYSHLARSEYVEMALAATRFDIYQRKIDGASAWSVPVLHLGVKTGRLFGVDERRAAALEDVEPEIPAEAPAAGAPSLGGLARKVVDAIESARSGGESLAIPRITDMVEEALRGARDGATSPTRALAQPQDRTALTRAIPELLRLRWTEVAATVSRLTAPPGSQEGLRIPDSVYAQTTSALNAGKHVVFIGPPGTGKTSLVHAIAEHARRSRFSTGTVQTTASADWTTFDTVGGYVPVSSARLDFRPGLFLRAIAEGRWLVLDELNRAEIDKAVGELFTVLSGQQVDLPYRVQDHPVRVLPPRSDPHPENWVPDGATGRYDYVIHPNWRILATMNVYDKSSLFGMSFAFMRRFAFVDLGIPDEAETFGPLRRRWIGGWRGEVAAAHGGDGARAEEKLEALAAQLDEVFAQGEDTLMGCRALGPAIAGDMIRYVFDRFRHEPRPDQADLLELAREAFLLYAVPQLDGLDRRSVLDVYRHVDRIFYRDGDGGRREILRRIEDLYPHIQRAEWRAALAAHAGGDGRDGGDG